MLRLALLLATAAARRNDDGWSHVGDAPADTRIRLTFALSLDEAKVSDLERELLARSTPGAPLYGQWLSNEEVHARVAPPRANVDAVLSHLAEFGVTAELPTSDFIVATVDVATAERILGGARYGAWRHAESGITAARLAPRERAALPAAVASVVAAVEPTGRFPPVRAAAPAVQAGAAGATRNTPATLRKLYNVTGTGAATVATNPTGHAVTAFLEQYYSADDLAQFWESYGADGTGVPEPDVVLVGDATTGAGGIESMLDIEYVNAGGAGIHSEFWGFAGRAPDNAENEPFMTWLYTLGNTSDAAAPKIFSTSYAEDEDSTSWEYAQRINAEFVKVERDSTCRIRIGSITT